ncbi:putative tight adherance operon protein [Deinococcus grandis]|uniref:Putative tight adherance operon protein n=1 Tax=Deinococcus grandis TaxID=57498 RepID=A0A124BRG4_9DEIO|nr:putative tight adherance operon protein [Deinococcus grandis]
MRRSIGGAPGAAYCPQAPPDHERKLMNAGHDGPDSFLTRQAPEPALHTLRAPHTKGPICHATLTIKRNVRFDS